MHLILLILHVLGATIIVGSSFVSLVILIKNKIPQDNLVFLEALRKLVGPAIGIQFITGVALTAGEWNEFRNNPFFWIKMVLFVIGGVVGGNILGKAVSSAKAKNLDYISGIARWAWIDFLLIATIAALGVILTEMHV